MNQRNARFCIIGLLLVIKKIGNAQQLICDPGFENQTPNISSASSTNGQKYGNFNSNMSCWFIPHPNFKNLTFEVKTKLNPPATVTNICDLWGKQHIPILCQIVQNMTVGAFYKFGFSLTLPSILNTSTVYAKLNNTSLLNLTNNNSSAVKTSDVTFLAKAINNIFCFNFDVPPTPPSSGPEIDNVTLKLLNQTWIIEAVFGADELNGTITLTTNLSLLPSMSGLLLHIQQQSKIYLENELQASTELQVLPLSYFATFIIYPPNQKRAYDFSDIELLIPHYTGGDVNKTINFKVRVKSKEVEFATLTPAQVRIYNNLWNISTEAADIVEVGYAYIKSTFFSYFLIGILNFWNLTLLYNFLELHSIPLFFRLFNEEIALIIYRQESLMSWIQSLTGWKTDSDFPQLETHEKIPITRNKHAWFGAMGLTSNFVGNNTQTGLLIAILIVKIAVIKLLSRCNIPYISNILPSKQQLSTLFIHQIILISPMVTVAASFRCKMMTFQTFYEILNIIMHMSAIVIVLFLFLIEVNLKKGKKQRRIRALRASKANEAKIKENQIAAIRQNDTFFDLFLNFAIPFAIALEYGLLFLCIVLIVLVLRLTHSIKNRRFYSKYGITYSILIKSVWIINHLVYFSFFIFDQLLLQKNESNSLLLKYLGFIGMFNFVTGITLQTCDLLITMSITIVHKIKQNCLKSNQIDQQKLGSKIERAGSQKNQQVQSITSESLQLQQHKDSILRKWYLFRKQNTEKVISGTKSKTSTFQNKTEKKGQKRTKQKIKNFPKLHQDTALHVVLPNVWFENKKI